MTTIHDRSPPGVEARRSTFGRHLGAELRGRQGLDAPLLVGISRGAVFAIDATRARCPVARTVAGGWYNVQAHGDSARGVYDRKGRRWSCRITRRATGTDPGYNPYTHVRCARKRSIVRFKLRS